MSMPSNTRVLSTLQSIFTFTSIQMKVKSSFRNHGKVTGRRTEHFLTIILNELLAAREPEWGFQSLAVHPPTWQALGKPKAWNLGTSVLFDLRYSTFFALLIRRINETPQEIHRPIFLGITAALICIASCARDLQAPNNSVPQKCGSSFLPCPLPPALAFLLCLSQNLDLESSSPLSWLLGAECRSWQENMQVSAWQV